MKKTTLSAIFENAKNSEAQSQSNFGTNKSYGKIEGEALMYKGSWYKISYVTPDCLVMDTDKLFGEDGDEFPLDLVR